MISELGLELGSSGFTNIRALASSLSPSFFVEMGVQTERIAEVKELSRSERVLTV